MLRRMSLRGLQNCEILFPKDHDQAKAILIMGATGQVGYGKLCQLASILSSPQACQVPLIALDPSSTLPELPARLAKALSKTLDPSAVSKRIDNITWVQGTAQALCPDLQIGWALEAIPESLELKSAAYQELFATLHEPPILSSTTSAYTTQALFGSLEHKERCSVLHPFFPHHKNKLWELVTDGAVTARSTLEQLRSMLDTLGYTRVEVADVPAFAADRIFCGLMLEAVRLVDELGCTPAQVDSVSDALFGTTPFKVHNMIPGANQLSRHCVSLCHQALPSSLFASPKLWEPYCADPKLQWPYEEPSPLAAEQRDLIQQRLQGMLACLCAYLLEHRVVSSENIDRLCTQALGFRIGACAHFKSLGQQQSTELLSSFLDDQQVTLPSQVAPAQGLKALFIE